MPAVGCRARQSDRDLAGGFFDRQISIDIVEAALLLGSTRWLCRRHSGPALKGIRSLHYFQPIVEEVAAQPPPPGYIGYLRLKLQSMQIQAPVSPYRQR